MGGLDKLVLAGGDVAAIRSEVAWVLPYLTERGGYIPCLDHTVPPNMPLANCEYYLSCVRGYEPPGA